MGCWFSKQTGIPRWNYSPGGFWPKRASMVQPDSTSGSLPDFTGQAPVRLGKATRKLMLGRLRLSTGLIWASGFLLAAILFLPGAPPGFQVTVKGVAAVLALLALMAGISFLHVHQLGRTLAEQPLGPNLYRSLTRFPQSFSALFFILALGLGASTYLWTRLHLRQSIWLSFIIMAMFMVDRKSTR